MGSARNIDPTLTSRFTGNRPDAIIRPSPWGYSSAGRALAWHARGQRFDPAYLHHRSDRGALEGPSATASRSLSSRGPGHRPFTAVTRVRIPLRSEEHTSE